MKKIAFLLAVCILACCLPVAAFAAELPVTDETAEVVSEKKAPRTDEEKAAAAERAAERETLAAVRKEIKEERRAISALVRQNKKARAVCRKAMNLYNKGEGVLTEAEANEIRELITGVKEAYASSGYDKEAFKELVSAARNDAKAHDTAAATEKYAAVKNTLASRRAAAAAAGELLGKIVKIVDAHTTAVAE